MSMVIYGKLGTMPGDKFHVVRKRKPPVVGELIYVHIYREWLYYACPKKHRVIVDKIEGERYFMSYV